MKKSIVLFLFVGLLPLVSFSQNLPKKIANQICKCIEKEKATYIEDMKPCFEKTIIKKIEDIYKYFNVDTFDEIDFDKFGAEIGAILTKECDYSTKLMKKPENQFEEDFIPQKNLDCKRLHSGDFYYLIQNPITNENDTTFVTIKGKMYLERMNMGRTYSMLDINWIDDCKFELIFKDSNDLFKDALSKPGERYSYEMVSSTPKSFIIRMDFNGQQFKIELFTVD